MAILLTGTGGLFTRFGAAACGVRDANLYLGATDISAGGLRSVGIRANNIEAQYQSARQNEVDQLYTNRDTVRTALDTWKTYIQTQQQQSIIDMADDDTKLVTKDITSAINLLINQMAGSNIYQNNATNRVKYNNTSVTSAASTRPDGSANVGNGVVVASVIRPDARTNEYVIAETISVICTGDSSQGGATARSEPFSVSGVTAETNLLAFDWALGSGGTGTATSTDPSLNNSGNLLTNSGFDTFTVANLPDNWVVLVGVSGTDILSENTTVYRSGAGLNCLRFKGDGATLSSVAQTMNLGAGTAGTLAPNTVYCLNFFARKTTSWAAGNLKIDLIDGNNAVINDDSGTAIATTVTAGTLTTAFAAYNFAFSTPRKPSVYTANPGISGSGTYKIRVSLAVAGTSGESVYIDDLSLVPMTQMGTTGVYVSVFTGSTAWAKSDKWNVTVSNDYGGLLQTYFWRLFNMPSLVPAGAVLSLQLPSDNAGTQTIADTLFT